MINLLIRVFVKSDDFTNPKTREKSGYMVSIVGVVLNIFLLEKQIELILMVMGDLNILLPYLLASLLYLWALNCCNHHLIRY